MTQPILTKFPGVHQRSDSNIYQFGLRAPKDLAAQFRTAWAVRCSLNTSDLRQANERAKALHGEWSAKFHAMRSGVPVPVDLQSLRTYLLAKLEKHLTNFDKQVPTFSASERQERIANLSFQLLDAQEGIAGGYISPEAEEWLNGYLQRT